MPLHKIFGSDEIIFYTFPDIFFLWINSGGLKDLVLLVCSACSMVTQNVNNALEDATAAFIARYETNTQQWIHPILLPSTLVSVFRSSVSFIGVSDCFLGVCSQPMVLQAALRRGCSQLVRCAHSTGVCSVLLVFALTHFILWCL